MKKKLQMFEFIDYNMESDNYNQSGKINRYVQVYVISTDEDSARIKAKLDDNYTLTKIQQLGEDWY